MQQFCVTSKIMLTAAIMMQFPAYGNQGSFLRYILGSQQPSGAMQKFSDAADEMSGFTTPVYQMNSCGKLFRYSSFNWFNTTWIDEGALENRSDKSIMWQLLHEKYHTIAAHDWRRIIGAGAISSDLLYTILWVMNNKAHHGLQYVAGRIFCSCFTLFLFLWHEEYCEHMADLYADRMIHE